MLNDFKYVEYSIQPRGRGNVLKDPNECGCYLQFASESTSSHQHASRVAVVLDHCTLFRAISCITLRHGFRLQSALRAETIAGRSRERTPVLVVAAWQISRTWAPNRDELCVTRPIASFDVDTLLPVVCEAVSRLRVIVRAVGACLLVEMVVGFFSEQDGRPADHKHRDGLHIVEVLGVGISALVGDFEDTPNLVVWVAIPSRKESDIRSLCRRCKQCCHHDESHRCGSANGAVGRVEDSLR